MFIKSARYYDALYEFKDYEAAAKQLHDLIRQEHRSAASLLDVGCGTGKHLETLQQYYDVAGLDLSSQLLEVAHQRLPHVPFHQADMVTFTLDRRFDVITCLFSAIAYVRTADNLNKAIARMAHHLHPHGLLIIEPWISLEKYWVGRITANFVDKPDLKIAWMYTSELEDNMSIFDINYLVGTPEEVIHFTERHEMGLFTQSQYEEAFRQANLSVSYDETGPFGRGLYTGRKEA